ncbi:HSF_DOMAIN domain-containing protein [Caerostris darwini]|uniref:HSF_DOMAIN domain-containing protein n=1 Tax=Caerostris darwini TaxID=1538125 RepID=A0AAV4XAX7_9ARAC|nr:HSF_DOMAIN domain-containing protein [Caerostris darwini]
MVKFKKFQYKLWRVLNTCRSGAVRWSETGDSIIFDFDKFKKDYLEPNNDFCKSSNVSSFIRQLNLYGFKKMVDLTRTPQANYGEKEYFNENFIKGRNDLLKRVVRNPAKVSIPAVTNMEGSRRSERKLTRKQSLTEDESMEDVKTVPPKREHIQRNEDSVLKCDDSPTTSSSTPTNFFPMSWKIKKERIDAAYNVTTPSANQKDTETSRRLGNPPPSLTEDDYIDVVKIIPPKPERKRRNQDSLLKGYDSPITSPSTSANFDPLRLKIKKERIDEAYNVTSPSANQQGTSQTFGLLGNSHPAFTDDQFIDIVKIVPPKPQRKQRNQDSVLKSYDSPTTSPSTSANFDPKSLNIKKERIDAAYNVTAPSANQQGTTQTFGLLGNTLPSFTEDEGIDVVKIVPPKPQRKRRNQDTVLKCYDSPMTSPSTSTNFDALRLNIKKERIDKAYNATTPSANQQGTIQTFGLLGSTLPFSTEDIDGIDVVKIVPPEPERKRRNQGSVLKCYDSPITSPSTSTNFDAMRLEIKKERIDKAYNVTAPSANQKGTIQTFGLLGNTLPSLTEDEFIDVVKIIPPKPERIGRNQDSVFKSYDRPTTSPSTSTNFNPEILKIKKERIDAAYNVTTPSANQQGTTQTFHNLGSTLPFSKEDEYIDVLKIVPPKRERNRRNLEKGIKALLKCCDSSTITPNASTNFNPEILKIKKERIDGAYNVTSPSANQNRSTQTLNLLGSTYPVSVPVNEEIDDKTSEIMRDMKKKIKVSPQLEKKYHINFQIQPKRIHPSPEVPKVSEQVQRQPRIKIEAQNNVNQAQFQPIDRNVIQSKEENEKIWNQGFKAQNIKKEMKFLCVDTYITLNENGVKQEELDEAFLKLITYNYDDDDDDDKIFIHQNAKDILLTQACGMTRGDVCDLCTKI